MSSEAARQPVELLLIRSEPPCRRCQDTVAVLQAVAEALPGRVTVRVVSTEDAECARYGAVLTPMVVVNGKIACAGTVPVRSGLERLVAAELAR